MADPTLADLQKRAGAVFSDQETWQPRALQFDDARNEYAAARENAALFDLSDRTQIEITGADRVRFLQNFCTNDVKALQPTQGCEAFITNVKGRVLGHVFVFPAPESIWLESVPGAAETLMPHLERYLLQDDAELHLRTTEFGELFVSGPNAAERLRERHIDVDELVPYAHAGFESLDYPLFVRRADLLRSPGYLLSVPREKLGELWTRLTEAGIPPAGRAAFEALRIEAVFPLCGIDITEEHLAPEVGRDKQAISYTKGCYLGQEPIARIDALGHVNRKLCGLKLESGPVPEPGCSIVAEETGKEVGQVTSAASCPQDGRPAALAYLRSKHTAPGTRLTVQTGGTQIAATVFGTES